MNNYEDIILEIKNGNKNLFDVILKENEKLIFKVISTQNLNRGDYVIDKEELYQEGCIALYKAVMTYEFNKGMSFSSYAYMTIRSRIITYIRNDYKTFGEGYSSIDAIENIDYKLNFASNYVSENPIEYHREIEFENRLREYISTLNGEDKQIIEFKENNLSYKQIAERLNIKIKRVDNRLNVLKKNFKKYIEEK